MTITNKDLITYPESDGKPMAENTRQFEWIVTIKGGLDGLFADREDVFVAGDLLWYPVENDNRTRMAPDAMVALGRPKGHRGSYLQWRENNIPPQVVFEVLSPGNRAQEMRDKLAFYDRYGVEEYYIYDPDRFVLTGYYRLEPNKPLEQVAQMVGWVSPRLGIRFELEPGPESDQELAMYRPDGQKFKSFLEVQQEREQARLQAALERERAESEQRGRTLAEQRLEIERQERAQAENRAKQMEQELEAERQRAAKLEALLKQAGLLKEE